MIDQQHSVAALFVEAGGAVLRTTSCRRLGRRARCTQIRRPSASRRAPAVLSVGQPRGGKLEAVSARTASVVPGRNRRRLLCVGPRGCTPMRRRPRAPCRIVGVEAFWYRTPSADRLAAVPAMGIRRVRVRSLAERLWSQGTQAHVAVLQGSNASASQLVAPDRIASSRLVRSHQADAIQERGISHAVGVRRRADRSRGKMPH